ncbi:MAG TPA: YhjD/YihY/BrkB family envelope integrity protein [Microbacterium sp.]|uniref:YihY/virulence factor BrkB family protein n=1 Tax=Microbacterium sp. TaxID=51671 RepID=UPI002D1089DF|nr:YhjD/YihY/BrkB family envelope integrity protein [Microbacterium sp.]HWI31550.1 YhjD/YihY/BrkB family envelope integrity protein [Microbacterium sp.]
MADSTAPARPGLLARIVARVLRLKAVRALLLYVEHRGPMLADSITYRTLFSVFAGVLLGFSLAALWLAGNPAAWQALIDGVDAAIPGLIGEDGLIDPSLIQAPEALNIAGILAFIGLVGAAIGAIGSLRMALRVLGDQLTDDVFWVWVILRNLLLAIVLGGLLAAAAGATYLGSSLLGIVRGWFGIGADDPLAGIGVTAFSILVVFILDAVVIAIMFRLLSGLRPPARILWPGALLGAVGLSVLQQLSNLFIGGADTNPLLASFASLIALLLWLNLSCQVILIAGAYIITGVEDESELAKGRTGPSTFAQRRVRRAELAVLAATHELDRAREEEAKERAAHG